MGVISLLADAAGFVGTLYCEAVAKRVKLLLFRRKFQVDAFESVLGADIRGFLDQTFGQQGWSWELKVLGFNPETQTFEVRFDDCGEWAGTVRVLFGKPLPSRFEMIEREARVWPPRG